MSPAKDQETRLKCALDVMPQEGRLILLMAARALAGAGDPIIPLYQEWLALRAEWRRHSNIPRADGSDPTDSPECKAIYAREWDLFEKLAGAEPVSLEGMAALAHVLWIMAGPESFPDTPAFKEQCAIPENRIIAAIWRAASGAAGFPNEET
jgi:hypothetical protein